MTTKFVVQTILLLFLGQLLMGGLGLLLVDAAPWAGLPVTLFLVWFLFRVGRIFREEVRKAVKRQESILPGRLAFFVALAAQVPGLALLPYWAPSWILSLWQGAVLPVTAILEMLWPAAGPAAGPWLAAASLFEIALFTWVAAASEPPAKVHTAAPVKAVAGEWAPARRLADVERRGRRVK